MEATLFLSSAPLLRASSSSIPPVLCPQNLNHRNLLSLPSSNSHSRRLCLNRKNTSSCSRASLRGNLEVTGVPTSVPVRVAHELLLAGHHYLDVRTPEEFSAGHADGAINIPYMYRVGSGMTKNLKFVEEVSSHFKKHDEIIVGCKSGKRSMMAATDLLAAGFTAITDIAGGYDAWTYNGLPTE
ncbi:hypothetical protein HS088_TW01G01004 [Tripterygium wilfordii]|uniref:Rhodanese domain-containing protein n=1 Tax=Tripterygium wilfordii TaxID=458696 RepID=A0A7J7E3A7_TRIWF|nr:thiosulfate sulfurtransferase 16, chloroplastic-like [Tripterygium wilfordii]KAF5753085.1 hypothetical protein HS088_TW01G01004 [Tripterygium wilfordii]